MRADILEKLKREGWAMEELPEADGQPFATYYNKSGVAMRLPCDPHSLNHYLQKGFTFQPPSGKLRCEKCGFRAKSQLGLFAHQRRHKENTKEVK